MGPVSPCSSRAGWPLGKEGGLCQGRVRKSGSGRECGNAQSSSARSLWGPFSPSMSLLVSISFPQDSNLWSRRLLSAPIQCRGMEKGCMAALSFVVIPARLEPQLAVPCRAPSMSLDPAMGAQYPEEQRWNQGTRLCASTGAWVDPRNKETCL